jgi:hypothetical protein
MRKGWAAFIIITAVLAAGIAGCEDEEDTPSAASTQPEGPSQPQYQRLKLTSQPATLPMPPPDWKPATEPAFASTRPTTQEVASTLPTSRPIDKLETPESAVRNFFELCAAKELPDIDTMRALVIEPPPEDELAIQLNRVRRRLVRGATWEIVKKRQLGAAAAVLYRGTYQGRAQVGAMMLFQFRDRWKLILGDLTPIKYTPAEKEALANVKIWADENVARLNAEIAATQKTTTQASSQPVGSSTPSTP